ncbi:glycoside hydrolase family 127 protein [Protaetiibacter intestinalis]|uniref:Glycoside hydrolase family 127 protein n=1 Tax=Protaetiibacter intestinalis TaxID=2419774 RepID=A0A387B6R2_9MICO|nr:beta-L-arabinofuranosidase domain-containing protein [Protaetiibacter intestinalis]AYF98027.1 glycoside hydrolase family 127 protein [Protaetiibacter intestinalis]
MSITASAPPAPSGPVSPRHGALRPLGLAEVRITGGLWGGLQELNARAIIDHCLGWMERIGWIANFDRIAGTADGEHAGIEFVDSEVYKLLEAMAWELGRRDDPALAERYDALVARVAAAQDADGYINTSFGHPGQRARYSDLEWGHELYCAGHLLQAAVARLRTGHDDELPAIARRVADHLWEAFGPDGRDAICGHAEIEVALAEFSRATGEPRHLELARLFVERRGHRTLATTLFQGSDYFQDDVPVRDAEVLRGHAVRALYLSAGALDVADETGDDELASAVEAQYRRSIERRSYLTGGVGSHHQNEEFGEDYELPADRAYAETCAAIGSVMVAWRLLLRTGDAGYADQLERTLLNAVLVSPRHDGRAFYYANTLHQRVRTHPNADDELSERAEASMRAPWFEVSCCPTNVARTLASLAGYVATTDGAALQLHQFVTGEVRVQLDAGALAVRVETAYPHDGRVRVTVLEAPDAEVGIALRVPGWADGATFTAAGATAPASPGYATARRVFAPGEQLELVLPLEPRLTAPDPRVDAVRGQLAVERGPLVLALEDVDLPDGVDVEHVELDEAAPVIATADGAEVALRVRTDADLPLAPADGIRARLRPYKDWANRGPSTMRVWIPTVR